MLTKLEKVQIEQTARLAKYFGSMKNKYKKLEEQKIYDAAYLKAKREMPLITRHG